MTTDSKTIKLTVLAKSDQAGQLENFPEGGVQTEFSVDRIFGVTAYFGPGLAASIVTLKPQRASGGGEDPFQVYVLESKDVVFSSMSAARRYDLTATRRPMDVEPMAMPVAAPAAEKVVAKTSTSTPHHPRAAVTAGSGF